MIAIRLFGYMVLIIRRKEEESMAVIYATLIVKGKRTFQSVPAILKEAVREILIDLELEELAKE